MFLNKILTACGLSCVPTDMEITGIACDSRKVKKGFLFAALSGTKSNGTDFLNEAFQNGAIAAFVQKDRCLPESAMTLIPVDDIRLVLSKAAGAFYTPQPDVVVAVTGTNGKTSTANFARQIWDHLGKKAACIGTLGVVTNDFHTYGSLTTPDSVTLHQELQDLALKGYQHTAIEASSHGLEQHRIDGVRITAAAFTNITRDHLDYHKTMQNYLEAKLKLFNRPLASQSVVLNADIPEYEQIASYCRSKGLKIIDYGKKASFLKLKESRMDTNGQLLTLAVNGREHIIRLPLAGTFQAMNALCALGLIIASGEDCEQAVSALTELKGAPGRLEYIGERKNGASVYVDYAHTPDALETILTALRPHTEKKLHVVFGCGGDRDPGKRPQMGAVCQRLADVVYITDDNPRNEDPLLIRSAILPDCPKGKVIGNRALAIKTAVNGLESGDILVIAGKGHETGQLIKGVMHPFDDREEARKAIDEADAPLWTAREIAGATKGRITEDFDIFGISIDTRSLKKGDLFIALTGEKANGHNYAAQALKKGAAGVLVSYIPADVPATKTIVVDDVMKALEDMGRYRRKQTKAKIIGVTGSSGKTTTKEMLNIALSSVGRTHMTTGNLNNNIGVPLTLARMPVQCDFAIIEMGINHSLEMTQLTELVRPDMALITMIGTAHCEFFKTQEDTAKAKAEIFKGMDTKGIAFLNADNRHFSLLKKEACKNRVEKIYSYGKDAGNDIVLLNVSQTTNGSEITVGIGSKKYTYTLCLYGNHYIENSLGVVGILHFSGIDMACALQALSQFSPLSGRGQIVQLPCAGGSFTLIDDAYNANPESMQAGIRVLGSFPAIGNARRIAVIGDMLELGEKARILHENLANDLVNNKIDLVYTVGENSAALFDILPESMRAVKKQTAEELSPTVCQNIKAGDIILVKGSFGSRMTKIVEALKKHF